MIAKDRDLDKLFKISRPCIESVCFFDLNSYCYISDSVSP